MKIIDPHLHFFYLEQGDYHWLKTGNAPFWSDKALINKTFQESDLQLEPPIVLTGFVHIEAGFDNNQPWRELAALVLTSHKLYRCIANINLTASTQCFKESLAALAQFDSFIGVRHLLDEQALSLLTNKQVTQNISLLNSFTTGAQQSLVFEIQMPFFSSASTQALCDMIQSNPNLRFVINHAGFPPEQTQNKAWQCWQQNLLKVASFSNTAIKCSGWEITNRHYQPAWVNECLAVVFALFGSDRMMLASNFPLCNLSKSSYQAYWKSMIQCSFFQLLTEQEKSALCSDNALKWYAMSGILN